MGEREIVEAFLAHIAATPRLYVGRVLNSGATVQASVPELAELVRSFMHARAQLDAPASAGAWTRGDPRVYVQPTWRYMVDGADRGYVQRTEDFTGWQAAVRPKHGDRWPLVRRDTLEAAKAWVEQQAQP